MREGARFAGLALETKEIVALHTPPDLCHVTFGFSPLISLTFATQLKSHSETELEPHGSSDILRYYLCRISQTNSQRGSR